MNRGALSYGGEWHDAFLRHYSQYGNQSQAAKAAGINRKTVQKARKNNPEFEERYKEAKAQFVGRLEKEAIRRAVTGRVMRKKYIIDGHIVREEVTTYISDKLLETLLRANAPDKYREPVQRYAQTDAQGNDIDYTSLESRADRTMALLEQARARRDRDAGSTGEGDLDAVPGDAAD